MKKPTWLGAALGNNSNTNVPFDVSTTACFPVISAIEYGVVKNVGFAGAWAPRPWNAKARNSSSAVMSQGNRDRPPLAAAGTLRVLLAYFARCRPPCGGC